MIRTKGTKNIGPNINGCGGDRRSAKFMIQQQENAKSHKRLKIEYNFFKKYILHPKIPKRLSFIL